MSGKGGSADFFGIGAIGSRATVGGRARPARVGALTLLLVLGGLAWCLVVPAPPASATQVMCLDSQGLFVPCATPGSGPGVTRHTPPTGQVAPAPSGPTVHLESSGIAPVPRIAAIGYGVLGAGLLATVVVAVTLVRPTRRTRPIRRLRESN